MGSSNINGMNYGKEDLYRTVAKRHNFLNILGIRVYKVLSDNRVSYGKSKNTDI